ncbi:MAG: hypothetical protein V7K26_15885 [Nostoc sp.]|uniref:hypothetical protein n=1 Tax=Nostoc sp. TaxID=1180 RepID=UPI002FF39B69
METEFYQTYFSQGDRSPFVGYGLQVQQYDARVHRVFHPQSELSQVPGTPLFQNLTLGFEVLDEHECLIARCVDGLTLLENLDKTAKSKPGWYRIVSDDSRLLQLVRKPS